MSLRLFGFACVSAALAAPCRALSWDSSPGLVPSPEVSNLFLIVTTIVMIYWMSCVVKAVFATFELNSAVQHESIVRVDSANLRLEELEVLPQSHLQQLLRARSSLPPVRMEQVTVFFVHGVGVWQRLTRYRSPSETGRFI
jgi:hypothetical protein